MIKNHWHRRQSDHCCLGSSTETRPESIYKRYSWAGSGAQGRATPSGCCIWLDGIQRTEDGQDLVHKAGPRHWGAAVGSTEFIAAYLNGKVSSWVS